MKIKTTRLKLEDLKPQDAAAIHELHSFPQVDQFNTLDIPSSIEETETILAQWLKLQEAPPDSLTFLRLQKVVPRLLQA